MAPSSSSRSSAHRGGSLASDAVQQAVATPCAYDTRAFTLFVAQQGGCESCGGQKQNRKQYVGKSKIRLLPPAAPASVPSARPAAPAPGSKKSRPTSGDKKKKRGGGGGQRGGMTDSCPASVGQDGSNSMLLPSSGQPITGNSLVATYPTLTVSAIQQQGMPIAKTVAPVTPSGSELSLLSQNILPKPDISYATKFPSYTHGVPFQLGGGGSTARRSSSSTARRSSSSSGTARTRLSMMRGRR
jgi:hypothetical protein